MAASAPILADAPAQIPTLLWSWHRYASSGDLAGLSSTEELSAERYQTALRRESTRCHEVVVDTSPLGINLVLVFAKNSISASPKIASANRAGFNASSSSLATRGPTVLSSSLNPVEQFERLGIPAAQPGQPFAVFVVAQLEFMVFSALVANARLQSRIPFRLRRQS